nr:transposase [Nitrosophilus labii]
MPGISDKTILAFLAEYDPLDRFFSSKVLVGYLGLYPTLEQSGEHSKGGHLAKREARLAKKTIYLAAIAAVRHNNKLRQYILIIAPKDEPKKSVSLL